MAEAASSKSMPVINEVELATQGKDESTKQPSPSKNQMAEALQHLVQGKRHLLIRDVHSAVNSLQEACRLLAEQHGDTADQCGEAYFVYGRALLELARLETGVLGNALDGESADDDEDDDSDESEAAAPDTASADAAPVEGEAASAEGVQAEADASMAEGGTGSDTASAAEGRDGDTSQECDTEEGEEAAKQEGDDEEEVPNIQLAWEVLELAKIIFTRQATDQASELKLAEIYLKLGEVSIEAENYTRAVEDLNSCLQIQKKHLAADDRLIAETHYHTGVAYSLANQYTEAIESLQASVDTILARIQRLNSQIVARQKGERQQQTENANPFYTEESEIKELEELLPDMREKIADMREMRAEVERKLTEALAAAGGAEPSTSSATPVSPVKALMTPRPAHAADPTVEQPRATSIGHLVKRKRPSDGAAADAAADDTKRTRQENGHNATNGHAESDEAT